MAQDADYTTSRVPEEGRKGLLSMFFIMLGFTFFSASMWTGQKLAEGLGLANIFGLPKHTMVLVAGTIGTLLAVWLYWNFCDWLNILSCTLPPLGAILILDYFFGHQEKKVETVRWSAVCGVIAGAIVANLVTWGIASINGMAVAAVIYLAGRLFCRLATKEIKTQY